MNVKDLNEKNNTGKRDQMTLAIIAATVGHSLWGLSYLFSRIALGVAAPEVLLASRFTIATLIMTGMILLGKAKFSLKGKPFMPIFILGILEPVYFFFESYAILYTNATYAGVTLAVVPVVGLALGAIFLKEYPTKLQALFCIFPIVGVIMITLSGSELGIIGALGGIFLICTLFASATYRTWNRKIANQYTAFERAYFIMITSAIFYIVKAGIDFKGDFTPFVEAFQHKEFVIPMLILAVFCSVICHTIVNFAAAKMSVMTLSIYGTLSTLFSTFSGVIFLHEPLTIQSFIGSVLIIFGIWKVTKEGIKAENNK